MGYLGLCGDVRRCPVAQEELFPGRSVMEPWEEVVEYSTRECGGLFEWDVAQACLKAVSGNERLKYITFPTYI